MNARTNAIYMTSAGSVPAQAPCLLLVDDDRIVRTVLTEMLERQGYKVLTASYGEEGLNVLAQHSQSIDAVILDREMPGMNGMEVVANIKAEPRFSGIPVIMLTGSGEPEKIQEGIDAGVYYYLVKPAENTLLRSVIESALRERKQKSALLSQLTHHEAALKVLRGCQLAVRTLAEAEDTACFLASCFPDAERVVFGLMEMLVNAVEHGNLGISYEQKQRLLAENNWRQEIDRRSRLPENADKTADVIFQHKEGNYLVQITDCGAGFDWKRYWHINPARATASHGRGIARARLMSFDRMAYNETGNQVTVMVAEAPSGQKDYAW